MRIKFHTFAPAVDRPKTAIVRVYNLSASTQNSIKNEFTQLMLQAGYQNGAYGLIFNGTIMRIKTGRENATDTFIELQCADGDLAHNFAFVHKAIAAGASWEQLAQPSIEAMKATGAVTQSDTKALAAVGGVLTPRGTVQFGLAPGYLNDIAASTNTSWTIENGVLTFTSNTGYTPGQAVVLNSQTGMVGIPEQTNGGIEVTALLNPNIKCGTRVQINNSDINQTQINKQGYPTYSDSTLNGAGIATIANDGIYRVLVAEHEGDSRGNDWYTKMICLDLDASAAAASSVNWYGGTGT
jgi:hypothetical protein